MITPKISPMPKKVRFDVRALELRGAVSKRGREAAARPRVAKECGIHPNAPGLALSGRRCMTSRTRTRPSCNAALVTFVDGLQNELQELREGTTELLHLSQSHFNACCASSGLSCWTPPPIRSQRRPRRLASQQPGERIRISTVNVEEHTATHLGECPAR